MFVIYLINSFIQYLWKLCKHHLEADSCNSADFQKLSSLIISSHPTPSLERGSNSLPFKRIFNIWRNLSMTNENLLCIPWPLIVSKQWTHFYLKIQNTKLPRKTGQEQSAESQTTEEHPLEKGVISLCCRAAMFYEQSNSDSVESNQVLGCCYLTGYLCPNTKEE